MEGDNSKIVEEQKADEESFNQSEEYMKEGYSVNLSLLKEQKKKSNFIRNDILYYYYHKYEEMKTFVSQKEDKLLSQYQKYTEDQHKAIQAVQKRKVNKFRNFLKSKLNRK